MRKIGVGIVGAGYIGEVHAQIYSEIPNAKLVGVMDVDLKRAEEVAEKHNCKAFQSYEEILSSPDIEGISVCTPDAYHREPVVEAARLKKHVLLEKPMASDWEDAKQIAQAVNDSGILCQLGFVERFHEPYMVAHDAVMNGEIGKVVSLRAQRLNVYDGAKRVATRDSIITFLSIHDIDLLSWFGGSIKKTTAEAGNFIFDSNGLEDTVFMTLRFDNGTIGSVQNMWGLSNSLPFSASAKLEIIGDKGMINVDTVDDSVSIVSDDGFRYPIGFNRLAAFKKQLSHFLNCIENNTKPKVGVKEGLASLKAALDAVDYVRS